MTNDEMIIALLNRLKMLEDRVLVLEGRGKQNAEQQRRTAYDQAYADARAWDMGSDHGSFSSHWTRGAYAGPDPEFVRRAKAQGFYQDPPKPKSPPPPPPPKSCWTVLGVAQNASEDEIRAAYRAKAKAAHPDSGGSHSRMEELNAARDEALKLCKRYGL